jgi:hypothetical protein
MVQVEMVGQPKDVGLIVAIDAGVAKNEQSRQIVLTHQVARQRPTAVHFGG